MLDGNRVTFLLTPSGCDVQLPLCNGSAQEQVM